MSHLRLRHMDFRRITDDRLVHELYIADMLTSSAFYPSPLFSARYLLKERREDTIEATAVLEAMKSLMLLLGSSAAFN